MKIILLHFLAYNTPICVLVYLYLDYQELYHRLSKGALSSKYLEGMRRMKIILLHFLEQNTPIPVLVDLYLDFQEHYHRFSKAALPQKIFRRGGADENYFLAFSCIEYSNSCFSIFIFGFPRTLPQTFYWCFDLENIQVGWGQVNIIILHFLAYNTLIRVLLYLYLDLLELYHRLSKGALTQKIFRKSEAR